MIDKKWKWVIYAGDAVLLCMDRPILTPDGRWESKNVSPYIYDIFIKGYEGVYEILHHEDGKIEFRKARPELKVDDPVLVRASNESKWTPRHFATWSSYGAIVTWEIGRTSFTSDTNRGVGSREVWKHYKLP